MPWYDRQSWTDLNRQLDQEQADHFGELFEVEPQIARPNKRSIPDPARPAKRIVAVYVSNDQRSTPTARRMTDIAAFEIAVEFNAADLPYAVHQGDRLTRCATRERYEVLTPRSDGNGHVRVTLCEISAVD